MLDMAYIIHVCDMIKGNESNVANTAFEILTKKEFNFVLFYIVFSIGKLPITL